MVSVTSSNSKMHERPFFSFCFLEWGNLKIEMVSTYDFHSPHQYVKMRVWACESAGSLISTYTAICLVMATLRVCI